MSSTADPPPSSGNTAEFPPAHGDPAVAEAASLSSSLPLWLDDETLDPVWVSSKTGLPCVSCRAVDASNATRRSARIRDGATLVLHLTLAAPAVSGGEETDAPATSTTEQTLILKQVGTHSLTLSRTLGLAREALSYQYLLNLDDEHRPSSFLQEKPGQMPPVQPPPLDNDTTAVKSDLARYCPMIYYAYGNFDTGDKVVIMEHLVDAIDSAVFFGPGSPHNWTKDLPTLTSQAPTVTAHQIAHQTFQAAAALHATHWKNQDLLNDSHAWLRGQKWLRGHDRDSWEAAQGMARTSWQSKSNSTTLVWDDTLRACVDKAIHGISWQAQQERLHPDGLWTMVHGDFWPGNVMYLVKEQEIRLLDWEMCGLGSGPQDLGQYVISNMEPSVRRQHDQDLVRSYHQELLDRGVTVSWEYVWHEYRVGGMERWMWFLAYFLGLDGFTAWAQFFHDQMASFLHDHQLTVDDFTQVRP